MEEMELVVQYARLWGIETVNLKENKEKYFKMQSYNSDELLDLLCSWKNEYLENEEEEDSVRFFYKKLKTI